MKKFPQMCEITKDSQIKSKSQLKSLTELTDCMSYKFDEYERERQEKDKIIDSMKNDMVSMGK